MDSHEDFEHLWFCSFFKVIFLAIKCSYYFLLQLSFEELFFQVLTLQHLISHHNLKFSGLILIIGNGGWGVFWYWKRHSHSGIPVISLWAWAHAQKWQLIFVQICMWLFWIKVMTLKISTSFFNSGRPLLKSILITLSYVQVA